jgi:L-threonylcarbamoyladenylate synthase
MIEEVTGLKISSSDISNISNQELAKSTQTNIRVSGSLENHYAPKAKVILDQEPTPGNGFIALAEIQTPPGVIRLAAPNSIEEFARTLYSALREGDHQNLETIYISQPAGVGLAIAIRDRLARSASEKSNFKKT